MLTTSVEAICLNYRPKKDNTFPIMLRLTKSGKRKYVSLGISVMEKDWDFKKNQPKKENNDNIPAIRTVVNNYRHFIPLFPEIGHFILHYLYTGINTDFPECPSNGKLPANRYIGEDYIYRHIKREIERNDFTCDEEEQDGVFGIHFKANYPYGSIDYGFLPYSMETLEQKLEQTEPFKFICEPCDIPELNNTELTTEQVYIKENQRLSDIFPDGIPANTIIDKTVCGIGGKATRL